MASINSQIFMTAMDGSEYVTEEVLGVMREK